MKIRVLSCAEREFVDAVDWYNAERPGLGYEFAEEAQAALTVSGPSRMPGPCSRVARVAAS